MRRLLQIGQGMAEFVSVALMAAMFLTFLVQIGGRYLLPYFGIQPPGWTLELCLTIWLWLVFWGGAFTLKEKDHVAFDILYHAARGRLRKAMALLAALSIVIGFLVSLPADWSYVTFYKIKRSATLHLRLDYVFSIYIIFAVAMILRYGWRTWQILRDGTPDDRSTDMPTPGQRAE